MDTTKEFPSAATNWSARFKTFTIGMKAGRIRIGSKTVALKIANLKLTFQSSLLSSVSL